MDMKGCRLPRPVRRSSRSWLSVACIVLLTVSSVAEDKAFNKKASEALKAAQAQLKSVSQDYKDKSAMPNLNMKEMMDKMGFDKNNMLNDMKKKLNMDGLMGSMKGSMETIAKEAPEFKEMLDSREDTQDLVKEAILAKTEATMYPLVKCDGCKLVAEKFADLVVQQWKPTVDKGAVLTMAQSFCESSSFPGDKYAVLFGKSASIIARPEGQQKKAGEKQYTDAGVTVLQKICKEELEERDEAVAKAVLKVLGEVSEVDPVKDTQTVATKLEKILCKRKCSGTRKRKGKAEL